MISFSKRLVIIVAIVVAISIICAYALIQKFGTLIIVPITIGAIMAIVVNIAYWRRKYHLSNRQQK